MINLYTKIANLYSNELENASLIEHIVVTGEHVTDINTADEEKVFPTPGKTENGVSVLPPKSWNVIRYKI